jgi:hypothetical protein
MQFSSNIQVALLMYVSIIFPNGKCTLSFIGHVHISVSSEVAILLRTRACLRIRFAYWQLPPPPRPFSRYRMFTKAPSQPGDCRPQCIIVFVYFGQHGHTTMADKETYSKRCYSTTEEIQPCSPSWNANNLIPW